MNYKEKIWKYEGRDITFRLLENGQVFVKLDLNFALSNGCKTIKDYLIRCHYPANREPPKWLLTDGREFYAIINESN